MECVYCSDADIHARIISENAHALAFPTNIPITPGHSLVVPKRHVVTVFELSETELRDLLALAFDIQQALKKVFRAEGFNLALNQGEVAGQSVPHLHLHIVPRSPGDAGVHGYEPRQFLYRPGSRARTSEEELREVASLLRGVLT